MGMYTELVLGVDLKSETPQLVIDALRFMLGDLKEKPAIMPDHGLFVHGRWEYMLRCSSCYFAGPVLSVMNHDAVTGRWQLAVRCNLKNYESEIEHFCHWIRPYIAKPSASQFMGYYRYEEAEQPTLLYV